jgi:hypothetical protein
MQRAFEFAGTAVDFAMPRIGVVAAPDDGSSPSTENSTSLASAANETSLASAANETSLPSAEKDKPIVVSLVANESDLPTVEGLSLDTTLGAEVSSNSTSIPSVIEVLSKLPMVLEPYLAEGIHLSIEGTSANDVLVDLNLEGTPDQTDQSQTANSQQEAPPELSSLTQAEQTVASLDDVQGNALGEDVQGNALGDQSDAIEIVIQQFLSGTLEHKLILVEDDVIFYDVVAINDGDKSLKTVTWEFSDGSSISLVGLAANLPHELIV